MVKRPLKDKRPIGPFIDEELEEELTSDELAILKQAEEWYQSVSREENKRKMMREYLKGITDDDFSNDRIERLLDRAGL